MSLVRAQLEEPEQFTFTLERSAKTKMVKWRIITLPQSLKVHICIEIGFISVIADT